MAQVGNAAEAQQGRHVPSFLQQAKCQQRAHMSVSSSPQTSPTPKREKVLFFLLKSCQEKEYMFVLPSECFKETHGEMRERREREEKWCAAGPPRRAESTYTQGR